MINAGNITSNQFGFANPLSITKPPTHKRYSRFFPPLKWRSLKKVGVNRNNANEGSFSSTWVGIIYKLDGVM